MMTNAKRKAKPSKPASRAKRSSRHKKNAERSKAKHRPKRKVGRPAAKSSQPIAANITIHEHIEPIARGDRYEDPTFAALQASGLGGEGDGAGTLQNEDGEITEVDFDVELKSLDAIPVVIKALEGQGAPKGSVLRYKHKRKNVVIRFGVTEGVAIYLDGVTQPREVYARTSAEELLDKLVAALDGAAEFRASWQGTRETSLFFYGADAQQVFSKIEPVLREYPLSRNARVVLRHGSKTLKPRVVQLAP